MAIAEFFADHPILVAIIAGFVALYVYINADFTSKKLPPRFQYLVPLLQGKFNLKGLGPVGFIRTGWLKYGPVFRIKLGPKPVTFLIGPEANKFFYNTSDKVLTSREVYHFTIPVFGKNIVYDAPLPLMQRQLSFLRHALNGNKMQGYVDKVLMECDMYFSKYPDEGVVSLHEEFSKLIIYTASRCLMGDEIRETLCDEVATQYEYLNDGMTRVSMLFPYFPLEAHRKRDEARKEMVRLFDPVISKRRQNKIDGIENAQDFLQELIDCKYENRRELTTDEIVGLLIACLFAGQHTSNITATWLMCLLCANKKIMPRLLEEQVKILGPDFKDGDTLNYDAIQEMTLLHYSVKEALRLFPPIVVMMRTVQEDREFNGYTIPAGDIVVTSPAVSHRIPEVFKNPDDFDPDRYMAPRFEGEDQIDENGDIQKKWEYIAFGEGLHQCLGRNFAFLQVKAIFSYLFRHFEFELVNDFKPVQNFDTLVASPGCDTTARFKRIKKN